MTYIYYIYDFYDWDEDNGLSGGLIEDSEMALLHKAGLAREYEIQGNVKIKISWKKGQRFADIGKYAPDSGLLPEVVEGPKFGESW